MSEYTSAPENTYLLGGKNKYCFSAKLNTFELNILK
jgi:hypothetical protein